MFSILTILIALFLLTCLLYKLKKKKATITVFVVSVILFLACSTPFLPKYFARKLERQYPPFDAGVLKNHAGKIYVHVLGSGYSLDSSLPATARLGPVAQTRLAEAIRIYRLLDNSTLICSGGTTQKSETQAEVVQKAAILLGVDSNRTLLLNSPLTTMEEARALHAVTGDNAIVVLATDAVHLPRAMHFFKLLQLRPFAAPTNYRAPADTENAEIKWWPELNNLQLTDVVLHEFLGNLKNKFL